MVPVLQQTLGIQLEFIVYYINSNDPVPYNDKEKYGLVLEVPEYEPPPGYPLVETDRVDFEARIVRQEVADAIESVGFNAEAIDRIKCPEPGRSDVWNVVPAPEVVVPEDCAIRQRLLKNVAIKVDSPVFLASEIAFLEIAAVIKAIKAAFWTAVPPICSLHVHVGCGFAPLKLQPVQRTASLLWLAEGLLNTLHAGCRLENMACYSLGNFSNMGMGTDAEFISRNTDEGGETPEVKFPMHLVDKNRPKPTNYSYIRPVGITESASTTPSRSEAASYGVEMVMKPTEISPCKMNGIDGVKKILGTTDTREIAELLSSSWRKGAYNFANLSHYVLGAMPERDSLAWARSEVPKPTIEFRQAAGSLDESWVTVWARICLALCGPAVVDSSDRDFFQLLYNCAKAEGKPSEYDVFDLLHDIGLSKDDIDVVHSRLISGRHEKEPVLIFHQPEDFVEISLVPPKDSELAFL